MFRGAVVPLWEPVAWALAALILARQLFETILDVLAWHRGLFSRPRLHPAAAAPPAATARLRIAVLVPAWREEAVIAAMLTRAAGAFAGPACRIYVGCYPNDAPTRRAVFAAARRLPRIRPVLLPHPGPTSKADCLNHLYRAARADGGFDVFLLHDAEDLVDAAEPAVVAARLAAEPGLALVQFPVRVHREARAAPLAHLYADEFADSHLRVQPLRAHLTGSALSAGVGTAIRADALAALAADEGAPFAADCLAEDYLLALQLARRGWRSRFLVPWMADAAGRARLVAVEECFPRRFAAAVRQRARWMIGIACQAPARVGWFGNVWQRLFLLQDRLMIICALADLVAAALALCGLGLPACGIADPPVPLPDDPRFGLLVAANLALGLWRLGVRMRCAALVHGWSFALWAPLRWPCGIILNGCAAIRAIGLHLSARLARRAVAWDKTAHRFPEAVAGGGG